MFAKLACIFGMQSAPPAVAAVYALFALSAKPNLKLLIPPTIGAAALFSSKTLGPAARTNAMCQLALFMATSNLPALLTGRMSYVDISWPWGLVVIGLVTRLQAWKVRIGALFPVRFLSLRRGLLVACKLGRPRLSSLAEAAERGEG